MKDNFSSEAGAYATYRPQYPDAFFDYLRTLPMQFGNAWDCGTGSGQVAAGLAPLFHQVHATDISASQLQHAVKLPNIHYSMQPAEETHFPSHFFDLVIAGQAAHWFNLDKWYAEVRRTGKEHAWIIILGYGNISITPAVDSVVLKLYKDILGSYWDQERRYIDEHYRTLPFPFREVAPPPFTINYTWTRAHLLGYLRTWSAWRHFKARNGKDPIEAIEKDLEHAWGDTLSREITFPVLLRVGKL